MPPLPCHADGLIDDQLRQALLKLLSDTELADAPPLHLWEQRTVDDAANPEPTWGLKDSQLLTLKDTWAVTELHSRLQLVYPSIQFFHMPADAMQVFQFRPVDLLPQPLTFHLLSQSHTEQTSFCRQRVVMPSRRISAKCTECVSNLLPMQLWQAISSSGTWMQTQQTSHQTLTGHLRWACTPIGYAECFHSKPCSALHSLAALLGHLPC